MRTIREICLELEDVVGSMGLKDTRVRWKKNERGELVFAIIVGKPTCDEMVNEPKKRKRF